MRRHAEKSRVVLFFQPHKSRAEGRGRFARLWRLPGTSENGIRCKEWHHVRVDDVPFASRKSQMGASVVAISIVAACYMTLCARKHKNNKCAQVDAAQFGWHNFSLTQKTDQAAFKRCDAQLLQNVGNGGSHLGLRLQGCPGLSNLEFWLKEVVFDDAQGRELGKYQFQGKMERATVVRAQVARRNRVTRKLRMFQRVLNLKAFFVWKEKKVKDRQHTIFRHCRTN